MNDTRAEDELELTDDIPETTRDLVDGAVLELGGGGERRSMNPPRASSPMPRELTDTRVRKRPVTDAGSSGVRKTKTGRKERGGENDSLVVEVQEKKNSEEFPANVRPIMYREDRLFDKLPFRVAAQIVWEHSLQEEKKNEKLKNKNRTEKTNDKLPLLDIPAGKDDAINVISEARKLLSRPVMKEVKDQMSWLPVKYKEITRSLPLRTVGLEDCVMTSAIEDCHDLTSKIEIKNFSPTNLRNSAKSKRQTASYDDGKLVVESEDIYGDLETVNDVVLAFNTLAAIWQKLHPHWPVAIIGLRVCFKMKLFSHCDSNARKVMIEWANRFLQANATRAANGEGPMSFERAYNLAGTVCQEHDYGKEPPAGKGRTDSGNSTGGSSGSNNRGYNRSRGRGRDRRIHGGRTGANVGGDGVRKVFGVTLPSGEAICRFWNEGSCRQQSDGQCYRDSIVHKHVCDAKKANNEYCQGSHRRVDHK